MLQTIWAPKMEQFFWGSISQSRIPRPRRGRWKQDKLVDGALVKLYRLIPHTVDKRITEVQTINRNEMVTECQGASTNRRLTLHSEIRKEAKQPTILSTRKPIKIGAWNVRTMNESGKCANVVKEIQLD